MSDDRRRAADVPASAAADAQGLPVLLAGAHVRALVVGGGAVAGRKLDALLDGGVVRVRIVAPVIGAAVRRAAARAGATQVTLVEREYEGADLADANLVIAATNVREVNARVARDAEALGRLACVADAPAEGAWTGMATHRAGSIVVAVAAGGVPAAAARIRDAIAARFGPHYADAVARLAALRTGLLARGEGDRWREATRELSGDDFCSAVESGALAARLERWEERVSWV